MLEMRDIIFKFLNDLAFQIKAEQRAQGRNVTGKTALSLEPEATDTTGILYGNISALALETGRKAGKVPTGFQAIIRKWMDDKGIFQAEKESRKNSIAYLIARKIKREGTVLYKQGGNSGVLSKAINEGTISTFEKEVLSRFGREIQNEVITTFQ